MIGLVLIILLSNGIQMQEKVKHCEQHKVKKGMCDMKGTNDWWFPATGLDND